jgi:hypothetical protein
LICDYKEEESLFFFFLFCSFFFRFLSFLVIAAISDSYLLFWGLTTIIIINTILATHIRNMHWFWPACQWGMIENRLIRKNSLKTVKKAV